MLFLETKKTDLIIVINDLTAEGCPILALDLIDECYKNHITPLIIRFFSHNNELLNEFKNKGVNVISFDLENSGIFRYFKIVYLTYITCRKYRTKSLLSFSFGCADLC